MLVIDLPLGTSESGLKSLGVPNTYFVNDGVGMFKKIQILAVFSFISCTTPETKRAESQWIDLDHVGSISCSAWPIKESELDISQMIPSNGSEGGFIATMRMRNEIVMPLDGSTVNGAQLVCRLLALY